MTDATATPAQAQPGTKSALLGPFLGYVTPSSVKVWLHLEGGSSEIHVTIHPGPVDAPPAATGKLSLRKERPGWKK